MKKLAVLLSVIVLAACGGGGDGGSTASNSSSTGETGTLTVKIAEPVAKTFTSSAPGAEIEMRRVVITNPALNSGSNIYQAVIEYPKSTPVPAAFDLPFVNGYLIEVLDYNIPTTTFTTYSANTTPAFALSSSHIRRTPYKMISYGKKDFNFTATATVSVTPRLLASRMPTIQYPATVPSSISKQTYTVTAVGAAFANMTSTPLNNSVWGLKQGLTAARASTAGVTTFGTGSLTSSLLTGPYTTANGVDDYYGIGVFFAKNTLLKRTKNADGNTVVEPYNTFINETATVGPVDVTVAGGTLTIQ